MCFIAYDADCDNIQKRTKGEYIKGWKIYSIVGNTIESPIYGKRLDLSTNLIIADHQKSYLYKNNSITYNGIYVFLDKKKTEDWLLNIFMHKRISVEVLCPKEALLAANCGENMAIFNYVYLTDESWDKLLTETGHELTKIQLA